MKSIKYKVKKIALKDAIQLHDTILTRFIRPDQSWMPRLKIILFLWCHIHQTL